MPSQQNYSRVELSPNVMSVRKESFGPGYAKTCLMPYANNKGGDQHLCCSLLRQYDMCACYIQCFKSLASFGS